MEGALAQESAGLTCLLRDHIASARAALHRLRAAMYRHDEAVMREPPPPLSPQVLGGGNFVVAASRPTKQALERFGLPEQTGSTPVVWLDFVEFGADPTGLHDSSEALSAAIAAAHGYGAHCTLFIPAGEYRLDLPPAGSSAQPTPPVMHPLTLRGVGSNRTLLRFCGARRRDSFPVWLGCSDSRLSGVTVLYGGEPDDAPAPGCAEVQRVDVLADDLVVSGFEPHRCDPAPTARVSAVTCGGFGCTVCSTAAAERLVRGFELWLEADAQHAAGGSVEALIDLYRAAAELLSSANAGLAVLLQVCWA